MRNHFFALLLTALIFAGCNNKQSQQTGTEFNDSNVALQTLGVPMPTTEILSALGPDNNISDPHFLQDTLFVTVGKPKQFLTSSVGIGNEWLASRAIARFLQLYYFDPNEIERFVQASGLPLWIPIVVPSQDPNIPPQQRVFPIVRRSTVITFEKPFDTSAFLLSLLGTEEKLVERKRTAGKREYYDLTPENAFVPQQRSALCRIDERTIVFAEGTENDIKFVFSGVAPRSAVYDRLKHTSLASDDLTIVSSLEGFPVSAEVWDALMEQVGQTGSVPSVFIPLLKQHLRALTLSLKVTAGIGQPIVLVYVEGRDEQGAAAIKEAIQGLTVGGQASLAVMSEEAKSALPIPADFAASLLNALTIKVEGTRVFAALNNFEKLIPTVAEGIHTSQTEAQHEERQQQQLESLVILARLCAMYHEENGKFPTDIVGAEGKPLLSWRVSLLPLMGKLFPQMGLNDMYAKFKLDEPWDSNANKELLKAMPPFFHSLSDSVDSSKTVYRFFDSVGTPFSNRNLTIADIRDRDNTLMFVRVLPQHAVEWTKPEPLDFDIDTLADVAGQFLNGVTFSGRRCMIPVLPKSDSNYEEWKREVEILIKGSPGQ